MDLPAPATALPPASPRGGFHPLLSCFVFVVLWQVASGVASAIPLGTWLVLHLQEVLAALRAGDPRAEFQRLLSQNGDLQMLGAALAAAPTLGVVVLCRRVFDKQSMAGLGLAFDGRRLALGFAAGAAAVLAIAGLLVATGDLRVDGLAAPVQGWRVVGLLGVVFLQSAAEELVCRGYLLRTLMARYRPATSVALVSLFFGGLHVMNPAASWLSFLQTTLIGVLFSQVCLRTGGLWAAIGLHTAWNWTLGTVASLPVSGLTLAHLFDVSAPGSAWMTGGAYGPEASVVTLLVVTAACVGSGVRLWRAPQPSLAA